MMWVDSRAFQDALVDFLPYLFVWQNVLAFSRGNRRGKARRDAQGAGQEKRFKVAFVPLRHLVLLSLLCSFCIFIFP